MREATREKIHSAAIQLFSRKGLPATGVQEIADAAGISIGLLYRHYKTKDEVFSALVGEALEGLEKVGQLFESDFSPCAAIKIFVEELIGDLDNEEFLQYMMLIMQPFIMNYNFPWMEDLLKRDKMLVDQLARLIKRGQDLGQFKGGMPERMAHHFFSEVQGIFTMKQFMKDAFIPPTAEMVTAFLMKEEVEYARGNTDIALRGD